MSNQPKQVAAIVTEYRPHSHADVIVTKLLEGYELLWTPVRPHVQVAALYTDQVPANDISRDLAARHGVPVYPTIREALTCGGAQLAVDGVVLVGEHGDYPLNEKGQKLYPRRRFFEQTVAVFRESGRVASVFNDKHLAYNWDDAKWMYDTARELGIPFMAGSSLPVTYRRPPVQLPLDSELEEIVAVGHGPLESYGFHALEMAQCLVERRRDGETGVAAVQCLSGDAFWAAWDAGDRWSRTLQDAALAAVAHADEPPRAFYDRRRAERDSSTRTAAPSPSRMEGVTRAAARTPMVRGADAAVAGRGSGGEASPPEGAEAAFLVEYHDGLRLAVLMLNAYAREFGAAVGIHGQDPLATCFQLRGEEPRWHFCHLVYHIEEMVQTGRPQYPVERTLLVTGTLDAAMTSRHQSGRRLETPHLDVRYRLRG